MLSINSIMKHSIPGWVALPEPSGCVPISGVVYGIALHAAASAPSSSNETGKPAPSFPVLYIKPRNTFLAHGDVVSLPRSFQSVEVSAMLGMVFGRDTRNVFASEALDGVAGFLLALDLTEPGAGLFRPPIREKCRDGFLPVGPTITAWDQIANLNDLQVKLEIDGKEAASFALRDSVSAIKQSIEKISSYMTLRAGDVLLAAGTSQSVSARAGNRIAAVANGLSRLECTVAFDDEGATN